MPKRSRASQRQTTSSNTYRFFIESGAIQGREVLIEDGDLAHQIGSVLRLRAGERVVMLDNCGWQYVVALAEVERGRVIGTIERKELAGDMAASLKPHGILIASGIIAEREREVAAAFAAAGLAPLERQQDGDWVALVYQK